MKVSLNADDFGWNKSCSDAIAYCIRNGLIQTTTIMPTGEGFEYAVDLARKYRFDERVGVHLNITEGIPLTTAMQKNRLFCNDDGSFHNCFNRYAPLSRENARIVYSELRSQIEMCRSVGLKIHHLDSHHHSHTAPFITPIVQALMKEFCIEKMRIHRNVGIKNPIKVAVKNCYNITLRKTAYSDYFCSLDDCEADMSFLYKDGHMEIMCHPDYTLRGELIDRFGDSYVDPKGKVLDARIMKIRSFDSVQLF